MASRGSPRTRRTSDAARRREQLAAPKPVARAEKPVVLVVDDDTDARMIFSTYLRAMGCDVFTANDGRAGVEKAIDLLPDIIVMDLPMPPVDGWQAIRRLCEARWTRHLPVTPFSPLPG